MKSESSLIATLFRHWCLCQYFVLKTFHNFKSIMSSSDFHFFYLNVSYYDTQLSIWFGVDSIMLMRIMVSKSIEFELISDNNLFLWRDWVLGLNLSSKIYKVNTVTQKCMFQSPDPDICRCWVWAGRGTRTPGGPPSSPRLTASRPSPPAHRGPGKYQFSVSSWNSSTFPAIPFPWIQIMMSVNWSRTRT